jgi:hypothetical protein
VGFFFLRQKESKSPRQEQHSGAGTDVRRRFSSLVIGRHASDSDERY